MVTEIAYWDCDDSTERLWHEDKDEAIESHLEGLEDVYENGEEIEVYGYKRGEVNIQRFHEYILEAAHDYLGERYDGEDGHEQCDRIEEAALKFVTTYVENYSVWGCELVKTEKVNVKEWIQKHKPEWLTDAQ